MSQSSTVQHRPPPKPINIEQRVPRYFIQTQVPGKTVEAVSTTALPEIQSMRSPTLKYEGKLPHEARPNPYNLKGAQPTQPEAVAPRCGREQSQNRLQSWAASTKRAGGQVFGLLP